LPRIRTDQKQLYLVTNADGWRLDLLPGLAERDIGFHFSFPTIEGDVHSVARPVTIHYVRQILLIGHTLAVDGDDQISA
jgi:hypothetical protein